jgi:low temperature requirement protein LtrA
LKAARLLTVILAPTVPVRSPRVGRRPWIYPPRLRPRAGAETRPTWLELFFDLVFVVVIARLSDIIASDPSVDSFLEYLALFVASWFVWVGFTTFADRFEVDDLVHRLLVLGATLATIVIAIHVDDAFHGGSIPFALASIAARVFLIAVNIRALRAIGEARRFQAFYVRGWTLGLGLWIVSLAVPTPARYAVWGVALAVEVVTPLVGLLRMPPIPLISSHIAERFGLFTIIVLGESVVSVAAGISHLDFEVSSSLVAAGTFVIAASLWWLYFDCVTDAVAESARYVYFHFLVYAGLGAVAPGALLAIHGAQQASLSGGARAALCGGVSLYLLGLCAIEVGGRPVRPAHRRVAARLIAAVLAVALAFAGAALTPVTTVALLAAIVVSELVYELVEIGATRADVI